MGAINADVSSHAVTRVTGLLRMAFTLSFPPSWFPLLDGRRVLGHGPQSASNIDLRRPDRICAARNTAADLPKLPNISGSRIKARIRALILIFLPAYRVTISGVT